MSHSGLAAGDNNCGQLTCEKTIMLGEMYNDVVPKLTKKDGLLVKRANLHSLKYPFYEQPENIVQKLRDYFIV